MRVSARLDQLAGPGPFYQRLGESVCRLDPPVQIGMSPVSEEDYESSVHAIAHMMAQWWDANGNQLPGTEPEAPDTANPDGPSLTKEVIHEAVVDV
jgi:hypothetical protein